MDGRLFINLALIVLQVHLHCHLSLAAGRDRRIVADDRAPSIDPDAFDIEVRRPGVFDGEFVFDFGAFKYFAEIIIEFLYLDRRLSLGL